MKPKASLQTLFFARPVSLLCEQRQHDVARLETTKLCVQEISAFLHMPTPNVHAAIMALDDAAREVASTRLRDTELSRVSVPPMLSTLKTQILRDGAPSLRIASLLKSIGILVHADLHMVIEDSQ